MEDNDHSLSTRLYRILDAVGASEYVRTLYWEEAITNEILYTFYNNENKSCYMFGSYCEGTTTSGLQSDIDVVYFNKYIQVVEKTENAPEHGFALLMISDADTMPGYYKLQLVNNRVPFTIYLTEMDTEHCDTDIHGRICCKHERDKGMTLKRNGPAYTELGNGRYMDKDLVFAYRCIKVPDSTQSWLHKARPCNWPSKTQMSKMGTLGCFFVGVGHPESTNKLIEWRISFSLQERELMSSLNSTQHKCYILLKMIKKSIIQPRAGDKSISSYHCKTCLFHVLENSKPRLWTRRNLIQGVRVCLAVLLQWVKRGNCPNFFIPEENMFDRLDQETLDKLDKILADLLKSGVRFLLSLQCDNVGYYLSGCSLTQIKQELSTIPSHIYLKLFTTIKETYRRRNRFLEHAGNTYKPKECLFQLSYLLQTMNQTDMIREHLPRDVRIALQSLLPFLYLQTAQCLVSFIIKEKQTDFLENIVRSFAYCIYKSEGCDFISSKLILATCYLRSDMSDKGEGILLTCETYLMAFVTSVCGCSDQLHGNESLLYVLRGAEISSQDTRRKYTTGCMLFLPAQALLVHPVLQLEMYRSVYTPPGSRNEHKHFWFDWILVDSRVYLYFLQYLLYSKTNRHVNKLDAIENLKQLICTDKNLGHRETAFNLLGWIYSQESRFQEAVRCFNESWQIRPVHNAAKWHLCVMLKTIFRQYRRY